MNLDALPLDVLVPVGLPFAALLWMLWLWLCRAQGVRDRKADARVQQGEARGDASNPAQHRDDHVVRANHARIVARGGAR